MPRTLILGNVAPTEPQKIDPDKTDTIQVDLEGGNRETLFTFPDEMPLAEIIQNVQGTWLRDHSHDAPEWVQSEDALLQSVFADHFDAKEGRPAKWDGERILPPLGGGSIEWDLETGLYVARQTHVHDPFFGLLVDAMARQERMLRTDAGKDFQSRVMGDTASTGTGSYAAATYIALTANSTAPAAGNTTLAAEITTAGGGLVRAQAAYAHTAGASTYTLTKTFTVNGSDSIPVTVAKIGVFNASSAGTMVFETLLSSTAGLSQVGDQVQVTETVTI